MYYSAYNRFGNLNQLKKQTHFVPSPGNFVTVSINAKGYDVTVTNPSITKGITTCTVKVGKKPKASTDGVIICS